ncbi:GIY-YIG nuclease family protein [Cytobacillus kochii]|uniref:GIY-YIG nuclease family protein n=1 Tax=Cytobacillus kochii TaxID=859143 RepID=UPI001CD7F27E|nr:GIY-YIG nuclease family protein [Cytobacillus kochii]MCA1026977.1 GIY-YIG nuclease family protein [Cytobacillus kochii]
MFTKDELKWIRKELSDYDPFEIAPSYYHREKTLNNREKNKYAVRIELERLREKIREYSPDELINLKSKKAQNEKGINTFAGIYIIYNKTGNRYYIGKGEDIIKRASRHFTKSGNPELYEDYDLHKNEFLINLIPLDKTSFSTLNELEGSAIVAYDSMYPNGYNRVIGNILDRPIYDRDALYEVSDLILSRIEKSEEFKTLTNDKKRMQFIRAIFKKYNLPENAGFQINFLKAIKIHQKEKKKKSR